jgi:hypothetical protein
MAQEQGNMLPSWHTVYYTISQTEQGKIFPDKNLISLYLMTETTQVCETAAQSLGWLSNGELWVSGSLGLMELYVHIMDAFPKSSNGNRSGTKRTVQ